MVEPIPRYYTTSTRIYQVLCPKVEIESSDSLSEVVAEMKKRNPFVQLLEVDSCSAKDCALYNNIPTSPGSQLLFHSGGLKQSF